MCGLAAAQNDTEKPASLIDIVRAKMTEMGVLNAKAGEVVGKVRTIAASGSPSEETKAALASMLQDVVQMKERLDKLQEDVAGILGWIEGQNEALPIMANDILELKRSKPTTYLQFQYSDSQSNGNADGFNQRRFRIGRSVAIDPQTSIKLAFDVSAGSQRTGAELKDAILYYNIEPSIEEVGTQIVLGQQPLPLGYELERSSSEREFPERALYNRTMFDGERGRGGQIRYGLGAHSFVHGGLWNSLTYKDPQQAAANTYGNLGGELAGSAGIRYYDVHYDAGVSGFFGKRPSFAGSSLTASKADRHSCTLTARTSACSRRRCRSAES